VVPVTASTYIAASREEVFDFLGDMAARIAFQDHYLTRFHLTRPRSSGPGAAARFRLDAPFARQWAESGIVVFDRPRRIAEEGTAARQGRTRTFTVWELHRQAEGVTRVEFTHWTDPGGRFAALKENLFVRGWLRRQSRIALERLRKIFEERPEAPLARADIAGFEPAGRFRWGSF